METLERDNEVDAGTREFCRKEIVGDQKPMQLTPKEKVLLRRLTLGMPIRFLEGLIFNQLELFEY